MYIVNPHESHLLYTTTECPDEWYGFDCKHQCAGHCRDNGPCNKVTGQCDGGCTYGWFGQIVIIGVLVSVLTMRCVPRRMVLVTEDVLLGGLVIFVKKVIFLYYKKRKKLSFINMSRLCIWRCLRIIVFYVNKMIHIYAHTYLKNYAKLYDMICKMTKLKNLALTNMLTV